MSRIGLSPGWFARNEEAPRHIEWFGSLSGSESGNCGGSPGCSLARFFTALVATAFHGRAPRNGTPPDPFNERLVGSLGERRSASGSRRAPRADSRSGPWNAILLAWGPWGETWAQVVRILAHRERESVTLLLSEKLYEMARRAPAAANHSANGSVPCHASLRRQKHKTAAVALEIIYKIMSICQGPF